MEILKLIYLFFRKLRISFLNPVVFGPGCRISLKSSFEGNNKIGEKTVFCNSSIGFGSYIGAKSVFHGTDIGRFCSIGAGVKTIIGRHPSKYFVSTHPAFFSLQKQGGFSFVHDQLFKECKYADEEKKKYIVIENDVWIGAEAMILDGVRIGNGAIIGARALVVSDIEPYGIYVGVPAKKIAYRFNETDRTFLLEAAWWNNEIEWIARYASFFGDIEKFKNLINSNR